MFDLQRDEGWHLAQITPQIAQNDFFIFFETSLGGLTNFYK
jgi:hypothetical protein